MTTGKLARVSLCAFAIAAFTSDIAAARTRYSRSNAYDGWWTLSIATRRGSCDRHYSFQLQVSNGLVTFQGPASVTGRVSPGGQVRVSVWAGDKRAHGSGRLSRSSGRGYWSGHSGTGRCSGSWSAQRY
jgi:hypothetical protein